MGTGAGSVHRTGMSTEENNVTTWCPFVSQRRQGFRHFLGHRLVRSEASTRRSESRPSSTPITPSGLNTQVNLSATPPAGMVQYDITGGTRPGGGANLFHSFGEFGVPTNNIANFLNDTGLADLQYPRSCHRRKYLQHLRHHPNHRLRERQSLPDESGRILVWTERHGERRRDGDLHQCRLSATHGQRTIQRDSRTQQPMLC